MTNLHCLRAATAAAALVLAGQMAAAQQSPFHAHDDYTEYQLLAPDSHQFHIVYYLGQRQTGAATVLNQTRSGSAGSNIAVSDPRTGQPLKFEYRTGAELAAAGETGRLNPAEHYIRAFLPRPVPEGGEGRVRIEKTYLDEKSYFTDGEDIVFTRSLGIGRNAIVLPAGYSLRSSNVAAQVMTREDGRVKVAFENVNGYAAAVQIRGRRTDATLSSALPVVERGFDFSKTLYELGDPAAHAVVVRHQYVETRTGARHALAFLTRHPLRSPVATDLDTGRDLEVSGTGLLLEAPLSAGQSAHVRLEGSMTDAAYRVDGGHLAWERTLHEPRTTILLPPGWLVTAVSSPGLVSTTREGRVALQIYNPRLEPAAVSIRAVPAR